MPSLSVSQMKAIMRNGFENDISPIIRINQRLMIGMALRSTTYILAFKQFLMLFFFLFISYDLSILIPSVFLFLRYP